MRTTIRQARSSSSEARNGPQSVGRVVLILEALSGARESATLSELAAEVGAPKTSLVGLLGGLMAERCLERDTAGRYRLGPRFISLAMCVASGRELITLARPIMSEMVEATGETAVLGALAPDQDAAIYLDKVESTNPIRYAVTAGERRELYCTGIGKILLAHFEPARLQLYLKSTTRQRFTATTITGARALIAEMSRVRQEGIARTKDERIPGASGIAAPIFSSDGSLIAALLIAGPSERMQAQSKRNEQILRRAASECSRLVGGGLRPDA
jgi:DNA-binding IclR family transcriptional regulator